MPDSGYPNYLNVQPDGGIGALFSGGVILDAGVGATPGPDRKITWLRESDGALVAEHKSYMVGTNAELEHNVTSPDLPVGNRAQLHLSVNSAGVPAKSSVIANAADGSGNNEQRTIIDELGRSAFAQLAGSIREARLAFGFAPAAAVAAGWGSYATGSWTGDAGGLTNLLPFYSIYTPNGASIVASHVIGYTGTSITVAINSAIAQNVLIAGLLVGWN